MGKPYEFFMNISWQFHTNISWQFHMVVNLMLGKKTEMYSINREKMCLGQVPILYTELIQLYNTALIMTYTNSILTDHHFNYILP